MCLLGLLQRYVHDNVMLGRAAWAGSQKYGGGVWSGDTKSTWQDLNQQFRAGLNMVMSGIPYVSHIYNPTCCVYG